MSQKLYMFIVHWSNGKGDTENLHRQERVWDDSVLWQGKVKEKGKKTRKKEKHQEVVSHVVAN